LVGEAEQFGTGDQIRGGHDDFKSGYVGVESVKR